MQVPSSEGILSSMSPGNGEHTEGNGKASGATSDEPISVLLVDDNEQWATYLQDDLEREDDRLEVTVALSANEAMLALQDHPDLDVIVGDYRMPEIDGVELLERIREDYEFLPYILVTAAGSEKVASTAIEAGVTDYLVKNPGADQTPLLAKRIRAAYESYRLRERVRESEQRYRAVTEQSHDGIVIVAEGTIQYANDRMGSITGLDRNELVGHDFIDTVVHREDQSQVRAVLRGGIDFETQLLEIRLIRPDGDIRTCEVSWSRLSDLEEGILFSIRDVTPRKQRERRLERERRVNRRLFDVLIQSATREEIERAVAEQLVESGYDLVWIGEVDGETVAPRVVAGATSYLDRISQEAGPDEPGAVAARTGQPRFIPDLTELLESAWREAALAAGINRAAAVPLTHDGVEYGVMGVYHREPTKREEMARDLLTEVGNTLAFALHHVETHRALGGESTVAVTVSVPTAVHPVAAAIDDLEGRASATILGTHAGREETFVQYVQSETSNSDAITAALETQPSVVDVQPLGDEEGPQLQVTLSERPIEFHLASRGANVDRSTARGDSASIEFTYGDRVGLEALITEVGERFPGVSIEALTDVSTDSTGKHTRQVELDELTAKQSAAFEAAFHHGYFEQPRGASASDIAQALDVSHSTFLQHLRIAQRKIANQIYGE